MRCAHRVTWQLTNGEIADGLFVLHKCDNPGCCNPGHLFLGTHAANMADKVAKGRQARVTGNRNGSAKLTAEDVRWMRWAYADGRYTQARLAELYGVSQQGISDAILHRTWRMCK